MSEPDWVTAAEVTLINQKETECTNEPFEVLSPGELESACYRAWNHYSYGETDIHRLAATYAEGVARNHPFAQGNKRSGFLATQLFLAKNGVELLPRQDDGYAVMMRELVKGERSRDEVATYLAENSREIVQELQQEQSRKNTEQDMDTIKREAEGHLRRRREGQSLRQGQDQGEEI